MPLTPSAVISNATVRSALQQAWLDSSPGLTGGHEEGGFILKNADESLSVKRWQRGLQDTIQVPPHRDCMFDSLEIVASFHTHPNTGSDYTLHGHKLRLFTLWEAQFVTGGII